MHLIGERLWEMAVDKKADWGAIKFRLYRYSSEFKEDAEYNASLTRMARGDGGYGGSTRPIVVVDPLGNRLDSQ
jgi:hypothetical protein